MTDRFADEKSAYREALARAEAGVEEVVVGETPDGNVLVELAEAVPAVVTDVEHPEPVEKTDTSEKEVVVEETAAAEKLLAGKFKTAEELERAYTELQSTLGRQGTETGELRKAVEELRAQIHAPVEQPPARVQITEQLIDENPARATILAYDQKDEASLEIAFEAWKLEDPFTASQWLSDKRLEQYKEQVSLEQKKLREEVKTLSAPQEAAAQREEWTSAFSIVLADHPDFGQHAERILEEVAPKFPNILGSLADGDAQAKAEILTALYAIDRAQDTDPEKLRETLNEEARAAADEARQAREGAKVVTQSTTGGDTPELSYEEQEQTNAIERAKKGSSSWERNWVGRS